MKQDMQTSRRCLQPSKNLGLVQSSARIRQQYLSIMLGAQIIKISTETDVLALDQQVYVRPVGLLSILLRSIVCFCLHG